MTAQPTASAVTHCTALGDVVAALVDGELDHDARERAQSHLLHCQGCRAEAEAQRRQKAQLAGLAAPAPAVELTARLLALQAPGTALPTGPFPASRPFPAPSRPAGAGRPAVAAAATGPAGLRSTLRRHRRRAAVGSSLAVLGVGVLIALGGPQGGASVAPVDPAGDGFVVDHVNRTVEVPSTTVRADLLP